MALEEARTHLAAPAAAPSCCTCSARSRATTSAGCRRRPDPAPSTPRRSARRTGERWGWGGQVGSRSAGAARAVVGAPGSGSHRSEGRAAAASPATRRPRAPGSPAAETTPTSSRARVAPQVKGRGGPEKELARRIDLGPEGLFCFSTTCYAGSVGLHTLGSVANDSYLTFCSGSWLAGRPSLATRAPLPPTHDHGRGACGGGCIQRTALACVHGAGQAALSRCVQHRRVRGYGWAGERVSE